MIAGPWTSLNSPSSSIGTDPKYSVRGPSLFNVAKPPSLVTWTSS